MKIFVLMALGILILGGCSTLTPTDQNLKVCQSKEDKISGCIAKIMLEGGEYYEVSYKNGKLAFTLLDNNLKCANGKTLVADEGIVSILHKLNEGYDISFYEYIDKSFNEYINFCEN